MVVKKTTRCHSTSSRFGPWDQMYVMRETNSSSTDMRSNFSHDVCTFLGNQEQSIKNSLRSNLNTSFQPLFCQKIDANPSKKVLVEALGEHYSRACVSKENGWNQNRSPLEDAARLAYAGSRNVAKYSPAQNETLYEIANSIKAHLDSLGPDIGQQEKRKQILALKDLACQDQLPPQDSRDFGEKVCGVLGAGAREIAIFQQEINDQFMELQRRCDALSSPAK